MARKKKGSRKKVPVKTDINSVEKDTVKRVNRTIETIENFLAKWNASGVKPEDMIPHIERIKKFHDELLGWQKDAQKQHGRESEVEKLRRLEAFINICNNYS
jgi:ribosomal protein S15P/S13E